LGISLISGALGYLDLIKLDAAFFQNQFQNLIEPVPDSLAIIHFQNIADARISGAEIGLGISLFDNLTDLKTSYTYLDPVELDETGHVADTLSYRNRHHWVSSLGVHLWKIDASLEYRYASALESVELFPENPETGQDRLVPISVWNASVGTTWSNWEIRLRVDNIFQYYYTQLERNMAEERLVTLTLEKRL
jgi:outer membrane cobalamin receptor